MGLAQYGGAQYSGTQSGGQNIPDLEGFRTNINGNSTKTTTKSDKVKYFKVNDEKPEFSDNLQLDGTNIDLTNADNVKIRYEDPEGNVTTDTVTIAGATSGLVEYQFGTDVIDTKGLWKYEYLITFSDGTEITVPNGTDYNPIRVGERL